MHRDTLVIGLSDFHSGGTTSLFPNRFWQGQHQNHTPTQKQLDIWKHFETVAEYVRVNGNGKRLIVVHDGDATDGNTYGVQTITSNMDEQAEIHIELMRHFLKAANFDKSQDKLYYVTGTEVHVGDIENSIAEKMGADGVYDKLELEVNGKILIFVHHGKKRGAGANEGNGMRNWLRDVHHDYAKEGRRTPDMIISGHTHTPAWNNYVYRKGMDYHMIHGVIVPSWQAKTRFAVKVAPMDINHIGAVCVEIKEYGEIRIPKFLIMSTEEGGRVLA